MPNVHKNIELILIAFLFFLFGIIVNSIFPLRVFEQRAQTFITGKIGMENNLIAKNNLLKEKDSIDLNLFYEAYKQAADNYYGFDTLSQKDLVSGMIKGFVSSFGDKHSEYFNIDETKKFN